MEGIKAFHTEVIEETRSKAEMITFVSMAEIEHARKELCEAGIEESRFSDGELIFALKQKNECQANTIVPIVIDWLLMKNYLLTPAQAIRFLTNKLGQTESVSLKALGDLEFDGDGKYFLIACQSMNKQNEKVYKVYADGQVKELWRA